jgi:hypothetical protein
LVEGQNLITKVSNCGRIINFMSFCLDVLNTILDIMDAKNITWKGFKISLRKISAKKDFSLKGSKILLWNIHKDPISNLKGSCLFIAVERFDLFMVKRGNWFKVKDLICS